MFEKTERCREFTFQKSFGQARLLPAAAEISDDRPPAYRTPMAAQHRRAAQVFGPTQVGESLNPINGYRGRLEQRGIKPKNHARDNLLALREKQKENRAEHARKEM